VTVTGRTRELGGLAHEELELMTARLAFVLVERHAYRIQD
jgi:hypothetical protein